LWTNWNADLLDGHDSAYFTSKAQASNIVDSMRSAADLNNAANMTNANASTLFSSGVLPTTIMPLESDGVFTQMYAAGLDLASMTNAPAAWTNAPDSDLISWHGALVNITTEVSSVTSTQLIQSSTLTSKMLMRANATNRPLSKTVTFGIYAGGIDESLRLVSDTYSLEATELSTEASTGDVDLVSTYIGSVDVGDLVLIDNGTNTEHARVTYAADPGEYIEYATTGISGISNLTSYGGTYYFSSGNKVYYIDSGSVATSYVEYAGYVAGLGTDGAYVYAGIGGATNGAGRIMRYNGATWNTDYNYAGNKIAMFSMRGTNIVAGGTQIDSFGQVLVKTNVWGILYEGDL